MRAPTNSGYAWLHNSKSLNIISLYNWPHTASEFQTFSLVMVLSFPFLTSLLELLGLVILSRSNPDPPNPPPHPTSPIGCPRVRGSILFPSEVEKGGEVPGLASEIIIVSIPPPSHFFILAAARGLRQLEVLHNVRSSTPGALPVIPLSCLPHPFALTQSSGTPPHPSNLHPAISSHWKTHIILTHELIIACESAQSTSAFMIDFVWCDYGLFLLLLLLLKTPNL